MYDKCRPPQHRSEIPPIVEPVWFTEFRKDEAKIVSIWYRAHEPHWVAYCNIIRGEYDPRLGRVVYPGRKAEAAAYLLYQAAVAPAEAEFQRSILQAMLLHYPKDYPCHTSSTPA